MNTQVHMSASQSEPTNQAPTVSALPWCAGGSETSIATFLRDAEGKRVCTMKPCDTDWNNALFIETAVNAHHANLARIAKLESALILAEKWMSATGSTYAPIPEARKALHKD